MRQNFNESSGWTTSEAKNWHEAVDVNIGKWTRLGNSGEPGTESLTGSYPVRVGGSCPQGVWAEGERGKPSRCKALCPSERANWSALKPSEETPLRAQEAEELDLDRVFAETLIPIGDEAKSPKVSLGRGGRAWDEDSGFDWTGDRAWSGALCTREGAWIEGWSSKSLPPDRRAK
jgi:hypothetical protein